MTNAERQRRYRERRTTREPVRTYQRPMDRRPRPKQWTDAVAVLQRLQAEYAEWRESLPEGLGDGKTPSCSTGSPTSTSTSSTSTCRGGSAETDDRRCRCTPPKDRPACLTASGTSGTGLIKFQSPGRDRSREPQRRPLPHRHRQAITRRDPQPFGHFGARRRRPGSNPARKWGASRQNWPHRGHGRFCRFAR